MVDSNVDRLSFLADWYDSEASIVRKFIFSYFPVDCAVEMFDLKNHKLFLKKTQCPGLQSKDMFVGNTLNVYSRQIKLVDYADTTTRKQLEKIMQRTFAMIKPDGTANMGEIFSLLIKFGCQISQLKMARLNKEEASFLYRRHQGKAFFPYLLDHISSGPVVGINILAEDSVRKVGDLVGPADPSEAKTSQPESIRAKYGQDTKRNVIHAAKTSEDAAQESSLFFEPQPGNLASIKPCVKMENSTCCIIKPHAVQEGLVGNIICMIEKNGFLISGLQLFYLDEVNTEEFLEVYKTVVPEYKSMVKQLSSGPCVAMEISSSQPNTDVPVEFRKFVGPSDPEIARKLRPNTLRAAYGRTKVENAVHVTDLPEDASLEVEYFFKILPS